VKKRDGSMLNVVGQPVGLSRTKSSIVAPPPGMGQHTDEVLKELGFSKKEISALRAAKAL
jgi:crotonobetainyl-CoA:carnitine CoA-transferase CaiB-like acyl-CoA transferase